MDQPQVHQYHHFEPMGSAGVAGPAMVAGTGLAAALVAAAVIGVIKDYFFSSTRNTSVTGAPIVKVYEPIGVLPDNTPAVSWPLYGLETSADMSPVIALGDVLEAFDEEQDRVRQETARKDKVEAVEVQLQHLDMLVKMKEQAAAEPICLHRLAVKSSSVPRPAARFVSAFASIPVTRTSWYDIIVAGIMLLAATIFVLAFAIGFAKFSKLNGAQTTALKTAILCWALFPIVLASDLCHYGHAKTSQFLGMTQLFTASLTNLFTEGWAMIEGWPVSVKDWVQARVGFDGKVVSKPKSRFPLANATRNLEDTSAQTASIDQSTIDQAMDIKMMKTLGSPLLKNLIETEVDFRMRAYVAHDTENTPLPLLNRVNSLEDRLSQMEANRATFAPLDQRVSELELGIKNLGKSMPNLGPLNERIAKVNVEVAKIDALRDAVSNLEPLLNSFASLVERVDALDAVTPRLAYIEAKLTASDEQKAASDKKQADETLRDEQLVKDLFFTNYTNYASSMRFNNKARQFHGTSTVVPVLVAHVEALVVLVNEFKRYLDRVTQAPPQQRGTPQQPLVYGPPATLPSRPSTPTLRAPPPAHGVPAKPSVSHLPQFQRKNPPQTPDQSSP